MPSPFPGMNPYLEQSYDCEDFHTDFMIKMRGGPESRSRSELLREGWKFRLILHETIRGPKRRFIGKADVGVSTPKRPNRRQALAPHAYISYAACNCPPSSVKKQPFL